MWRTASLAAGQSVAANEGSPWRLASLTPVNEQILVMFRVVRADGMT